MQTKITKTMKPLMSLFMILITLLAASCGKEGEEELPDAMDCLITGKLRTWESDKPVWFDPAQPPTVMLMEQRYYTPWSPYRVPLQKLLVNSKGEYEFLHRLEREKEYYLEITGYDTEKYLDFNTSQKVQFRKLQKIDIPVVAKSWISPRFINQTNLPGDSFQYFYGAGGVGWSYLVGGKLDSTMVWKHATWGGSKIGSMDHHVKARLIRNGTDKDTTIYYSVPPGDTSVITIRY
jgi:hypothetical protein